MSSSTEAPVLSAATGQSVRHTVAVAYMMWQDVLYFTFVGYFGYDRRVAQLTVVQCQLCLLCFLACAILAQRDALVQVEMEVYHRTVLQAQRTQSGSLNLNESKDRKIYRGGCDGIE